MALEENQAALMKLFTDTTQAFEEFTGKAASFREQLATIDQEVGRSGATGEMAEQIAIVRRMIDAMDRGVVKSNTPTQSAMATAGIEAKVTGRRGPSKP